MRKPNILKMMLLPLVVFLLACSSQRSPAALTQEHPSEGGSGAPAVSLSASSLTFPTQTVGTTSGPQPLTFSNTGTAALTITSISAAGPFAQTNNCPLSSSTLAAGSNCTISVTFAPTASGAATGTLSVADNGSGSPRTVGLAGTGVAASPSVTLSPTSLTFASQVLGVASAPQTVTVSNSGNGALSISSITVTGAEGSEFAETNTCGASVDAGATCSINVIFTPSVAGAAAATVNVNDIAPNAPQTVSLSGTGLRNSLAVITNALSSTYVGFLYDGQLKATGGTPPYQWSVSSGQLPPGLSIDPGTGAISGSATGQGSFSLQVQARDSSSPPATSTKAFAINVLVPRDAYGGSPQLACPSGAASHFYAQKIQNRWWLCTPAGNAFWMQSAYVVDVTNSVAGLGISYANQAVAKYGDDNVTWGPQQNRRLLAWGFNSLGEYASAWTQATTPSSSWPGGTQPVPIPFVGMIDASFYTLTNAYGYANAPVKDLIGAISSSAYTGYRGVSPDIWDPNYQLWIDNCMRNDPATTQWINGTNNSYLIGFNVDDIDYLEGFGPGPDFDPVTNGVATADKITPNLAWLILVTPATQTSNSQFGLTYSDTTVYSKQALMNFLTQRYETIAALDLAWGAAYTTFGLGTGLNIGTGLLDEVGLSPWIPKDYINLSDGTSALQQDLSDFLLMHMQKYFSLIKSEVNLRAPGRLYLGPTTLGGWGAPPRRQILQAAASSLDAFVAGPIPAGVSDDQQRIDFVEQYFGDKPWLEWEGSVANPDSEMSAFAPGDTSAAQSSTQPQRGALYTSMLNSLINARATYGSYPVIGYKWWQFTDNPGQEMNWGLLTLRDNEYDGKAATIATGTDAWGYPTGGEVNNYEDFLDSVIGANQSVMPTLLSKSW